MVKQYATLKGEIDTLKESAGITVMEDRLDEITSKIKDVARSVEDEAIASAGYGKFRLSVSRPFKSFYDLKAIEKFASKKELGIIEETAIKKEVDKEKFEELVKSGFISRELKQKAFREEAQTPRVSIVEEKEK